MIIDVHTHLSTRDQWGTVFTDAFDSGRSGNGQLNLHVTPERHQEAMQQATRAIVFGINSLAQGMSTPNDDIAEYARAYPEKIIGFMSIDPNDPNALEELERSATDLGLKGIKMSPVYQDYDPLGEPARAIHRRAQQLGLPILTHAAFQSIATTPMKWANPLLYDDVAREFPDLKIILAHIGLPWYVDAMVMIRKHPNVYADISGGIVTRPWWGYQALAACQENSVMGKLLFGSDFPISTIDQTIAALRNINQFTEGTHLPKVSLDEIEAIIHRDSLPLLGLE